MFEFIIETRVRCLLRHGTVTETTLVDRVGEAEVPTLDSPFDKDVPCYRSKQYRRASQE